MTQLILIDSSGKHIPLPETSHDKYACYPESLDVEIDMISGRRIREIKGTVQKISYSYDYMEDSLYREVLSMLRAAGSISALYLPDDSDEMRSGVFFRETLNNPTFAFSSSGKALWHNVSFVLREVRPHA